MKNLCEERSYVVIHKNRTFKKVGFFHFTRSDEFLNTPSRNSGFSLVEISIVIAVIGLIVGGVLTGQSLIRSSEVRSILSDYEKIKTAISNFEQKYDAIPGDFDNAQAFWGAVPLDCYFFETTIATCNGDGNGLIDVLIPVNPIGNEIFLFWKHLANAGFISGDFVGMNDTTVGVDTHSTSAKNVPSGKISGSLWYTAFWGTKSGDSAQFDGVYNNMMYIGLYRANAGPYNPVITTSEMSAMDIKIDDGKPGTGNLRSRLTGGTCAVKTDGVTAATSTDTDTAIYKVNATGAQCVPTFPNAF